MIRVEKNETVLKKHVAAIHCSTGLTLIQRKMSNALLFHAFPNLMTEEEHTITISQICKIIGYNSYNYELIKSSLRALMTTLIEWNVTNEDLQSEDWSASTIISGVRLADNHCTYSYSPHIKRLLSNPSIYGQINLIIQSQFKSSYGLALYENCVRYKGLSSTKWMDYLVFRKLMGVEEGKYHIFRDFKKRVLDRAVLEVNTYSDLSIQYELKTEKRNVKLIRFLIQKKEKKKKLGSKLNYIVPEFTDEEKILFNQLLQEFFLSETQAAELVQRYGYDYINKKIEIVKNSSAYTKNKINDLRAYFITAVRDDFQPNAPKSEILKQDFFPNEKQPVEDSEKQLKQKYGDYINKKIEAYYFALNQEEQERLTHDFINFVKSKLGAEIILNAHQKHGLESFLVKTKFINYIKSTINFKEIKLDSMKEWLNNDN